MVREQFHPGAWTHRCRLSLSIGPGVHPEVEVVHRYGHDPVAIEEVRVDSDPVHGVPLMIGRLQCEDDWSPLHGELTAKRVDPSRSPTTLPTLATNPPANR